MPIFVLVAPGGTTLGAWDLEEDEAHDDALIERDGHPPRRVVGRIESGDPEQFDVPVVERAFALSRCRGASTSYPLSGSSARRRSGLLAGFASQ